MPNYSQIIIPHTLNLKISGLVVVVEVLGFGIRMREMWIGWRMKKNEMKKTRPSTPELELVSGLGFVGGSMHE